MARAILAHLGFPTAAPKASQGVLFQTGPPDAPEPDVPPAWSDEDYAQALPDEYATP